MMTMEILTKIEAEVKKGDIKKMTGKKKNNKDGDNKGGDGAKEDEAKGDGKEEKEDSKEVQTIPFLFPSFSIYLQIVTYA